MAITIDNTGRGEMNRSDSIVYVESLGTIVGIWVGKGDVADIIAETHRIGRIQKYLRIIGVIPIGTAGCIAGSR